MKLSSFFTRKHKPLKPQIGDPQQSVVYTLERGILGNSVNTHCSRAHLQAVIKHACNKYRVPAPRLAIVSSPQRVFGMTDDGRIELNRKYHGDNLGTLLHELAHWITDRLEEDDDPIRDNHGPEFVGIYGNLLHAYKVLPFECYKLLVKRHKLKMRSYPLPD